jgi:hypothetical protein
MRLLIRVFGLIGWLLAVVAIGLGVAGVSAAVNPVPDETTRPELFARTERALAPAMATLASSLDALDIQVESLAATARAALVHLSAQDTAGLSGDLTAGDTLVAEIEAQAAQVQAAIEALPYEEGRDLLGGATRARIAAALDAVDAVMPLAELWADLSASTVPTVDLITALLAHDQRTFAAVGQGVGGRYAAALEDLTGATAELDAAGGIRDKIAGIVDTGTLDQWIARNRHYDATLVGLYTDLRASGGAKTPALKAELAAVEAARQLLPPDTKALIVIVGDLAQGGLNQAAIALEQARGALADAVAAVH